MRTLVLIGIGALSAATSAFAADEYRLNDRLKAVEQSLKELQAAVRERGAATAGTDQQWEQVRADLQAAQGEAQGVLQQLQMYKEEINRFRQDIDERLRTVEERMQLGGAPPATSGTASTTTGPTTATATAGADIESAAYQKGLNLVHTGDYLNAANSFRQFVQTYPKNALVPNAQYWIGECYYAMRDYQRAIKEYQIVVERYGRNEKANAALLKQGFAFESLGMMDEAKLFLQKLVAKAPNSAEARKAAERLKVLEAARGKPPGASSTATTTTPAPAARATAPPTTPRPATTITTTNSHQEVPLAPGVNNKATQESYRSPMVPIGTPTRDAVQVP